MTTTTKSLSDLTTVQLRAECKARGIAYSGNDRKNDLIDKINAAPSAIDAKLVERTLAPETTGAIVTDYAPATVDERAALRGVLARDGQPASTNRSERVRFAAEEAKVVKSWRRAGGKGEMIATPNLDALNAESASAPRKQTGAKAQRASVNTTRTPKTPKVAMTYLRNGVPMPTTANKFSCLAYQCTKGIDPESPARISADRLRAILATEHDLVGDPTQGTWEVTLSNGVTIGARPAS